MPSVTTLVQLSDGGGGARPVSIPADVLEDDAFWFFAVACALVAGYLLVCYWLC